jgi:O-antigen/teichoic acid export membrane protein
VKRPDPKLTVEAGAIQVQSGRGRLLLDTGWYSIVPIGQRVIALALLPLYTFYLGIDEYGVLALVSLAVMFVSQMGSSGIAYSVQRDYPDYSGDGAREYLFTAAAFNVVVSGAVYAISYAVCLAVLPRVFPTWKAEYLYYLRLGLTTQYLIDSTIVVTTWLVVNRRSRFYAVIQLVVSVVAAAFQVFLLVSLKLGLLAIFYGNLLSATLSATIGIAILFPAVKPRVRLDAVRRILEYTWQLVPNNLVGYFLRRADRVMLQALMPIGALGLYEFGARAQLAMQIYAESVKKAWRPVYLRQLKDGASRAELYAFGNMVFELSLLVTLGLMLFTKEALQVLTAPAYHGAYLISSLLIAQTFFQTIVSFVGGNSLVYEKKLYLSVLTTIISAGISLSLSWVLIPRVGAVGAALAGFVAFAAFAASQSILALRFTKVGCVVDWKRWFALFGMALVVTVPIFADLGLGFWWLLILKMALLTAAAVTIAVMERTRILDTMRRRAPALYAFFYRFHLSTGG